MSAAARSDSRTSSSSRKRLGRASNLGRITLLPTVPVAVRRSCLASAQRLLSFVRCGSLYFAPLLSPTPARAHGAADHGRAPAGRPAAVARVLARATAGSPRRTALRRHRLRACPSSPLAPTSTPGSAADALPRAGDARPLDDPVLPQVWRARRRQEVGPGVRRLRLVPRDAVRSHQHGRAFPPSPTSSSRRRLAGAPS